MKLQTMQKQKLTSFVTSRRSTLIAQIPYNTRDILVQLANLPEANSRLRKSIRRLVALDKTLYITDVCGNVEL